MSEYEKIIEAVGKRRGRKPLAPEERERRRSIQREQNRKRQEARRRALLVLQHRHADEFDVILSEEINALTNSAPES